MRFERIHTTLTLYPTFCGWTTKSISYAPGTCSSTLDPSVGEPQGGNSGDGTLSVIDVRAKKLEPFAQSEDQEDELLSVVAIKGYMFRRPLDPR